MKGLIAHIAKERLPGFSRRRQARTWYEATMKNGLCLELLAESLWLYEPRGFKMSLHSLKIPPPAPAKKG